MDRTRLLAYVAAALLMLVAACAQSPSITLTLDTASTELVRGGEVEVEVTLTRTGGATADVQLTVTGLPDNVSASFSPETLSGAALTSTLTLSSTAAATASSNALSVSATGTGLTSATPLALQVVSLEVSGRVQLVSGGPAVGVAVRSQGETTVTDENGGFELTDLSIPYDLSVWYTPGGWVQIYQGLTAAELDLAPVAAKTPVGPTRSAVVSGTLSGGALPGALTQPTTVCAEGIDAIALGCVEIGEGETSYSLGVEWFGDTTREVRVHALQTERAISGTSTAFLGYATSTTALHDTLPTSVNLDLGSALPTTTVSVDFDTSASGIAGSIGAVQLGPNLTLPISIMNDTASSHDILMPVIAGTTYTFLGVATLQQFGWQAGVTSATANVAVPGAATLVAPPFGATSITTSTVFSASNPTGGPLTFEWVQGGGGLSIAVTTMDATATIPDLAPYGLTLPGLTDFTWRVYAQSGSNPEDGLRTLGDYHAFVELLLRRGSTGFAGAGSFAQSADRDFTTSGP